MQNKSQLGLAISLAIYSSFYAAQSVAQNITDSAKSIETIVVTANRIEQPISQVLASVK